MQIGMEGLEGKVDGGLRKPHALLRVQDAPHRDSGSGHLGSVLAVRVRTKLG